jgi:hypothetical protein
MYLYFSIFSVDVDTYTIFEIYSNIQLMIDMWNLEKMNTENYFSKKHLKIS